MSIDTTSDPRTLLTTYIVLKAHPADPDGQQWAIVNHGVEARSAEAAIRADLADSASEGTYVAVPALSWKPVAVKAETRTVLTLEQPT